MPDWMSTTIGELLEGDGGSVKTGPFGTVLKASEYSPVGVPVISVGEVRHGELVIQEKTPRVSAQVTARLPEYVLREGDIVFARKGAVDRSAYVKLAQDGWFLGSDGIRLRFGSKSVPKFLAYQLQVPGVREWLLQHAAGSTMLSLNQEVIERVPIILPSLTEQTAIAEVLGALDAKISHNIHIETLADDFLASLIRRTIADARVDDVLLGEIATVNGTSIAPNGGTLRYVDIASVGDGRYDFPSPISWDEAPSRARRKVSRGDTLWSTVRPGRRSHALNLFDDLSLVASTGLAVLTPRTVGFAYLYEVTKLPAFSAYLETVAEGSAYPAVRADRFSMAPVPMVSGDALRAFDKVAGTIREHLHSLSMESARVTATRDALLPALMSGRLRVRDAEYIIEDAV